MPAAAANRMIALAREAVEFRLQQRAEDLAHAVGAEVEAQDAVAILHALVVTDHGGDDELVGHVVRVGVAAPP